MASLLSVLLKALGKKQPGFAPKFTPPTLPAEPLKRIERERLGLNPREGLPSVVQKPGFAELPPEDAEFLLELGMPPDADEWEQPYAIPPTDRQAPIPQEAKDEVFRGTWITPLSSNVDSWRFVELERRIEVRFLSGSLYSYANCSRNEATQFYASPSAGRFVWYVLRANPGKYPFTRLRGPSRDAAGRILFAPKRRLRLLSAGKRGKR